MKKNQIIALALSAFLLLPTQNVLAVGSAGFENAGFSARSLGEGNAVVAQADEPAAISYNPAGIADLRGIQVQQNANFLSMITHYDTRRGEGQSGGTINFIPTSYVTVNPGEILDNRVTFGVGADSPFGLANKYDSNHENVHYTGYVNKLKMFTIKPTIAVRVADWLNIGGGPVFNNVYDAQSIRAYPNVLIGLPLPDGQTRAVLDGTSWGWQFGLQVKPNERHKVGFYFRSPSTTHLKGKVKVENATIGGNFETNARSKLDLPLNVTVGYAYSPTDRTTYEADFGFTRWSAFDRSYIAFDNVNAIDTAILGAVYQGNSNDTDYRNSFSIHLGANHKFTDRFTGRGGVLFYTAASPKNHFTPVVPDANRLAFSLGTSYEVMKGVNLDMAYFLMMFLRRNIDNSHPSETVLGNTVDGRYWSIVQDFVISVRIGWENIFGAEQEITEASSVPPKEFRQQPAAEPVQVFEQPVEQTVAPSEPMTAPAAPKPLFPELEKYKYQQLTQKPADEKK